MAKVLIVDDAAFMRMMIKDILEKNGFEVVGEANNGIKAVELYKVEKPDVLLWILQCLIWMELKLLKQLKHLIQQQK